MGQTNFNETNIQIDSKEIIDTSDRSAGFKFKIKIKIVTNRNRLSENISNMFKTIKYYK